MFPQSSKSAFHMTIRYREMCDSKEITIKCVIKEIYRVYTYCIALSLRDVLFSQR